MPSGCHIASCRPLIAPPSCCLVVPAGCCIASRRPLIEPPSHRLVTPAGCCIASCLPCIALPSRRLVVSAGCCIASCRPLVAPPCRQLVVPACCRIASPRPLVAPHAAGCCVASRLPTLSLSRCIIVPPLARLLVVVPTSLVVLSLHRPLVFSSCWLVVALSFLALPYRPLIVVHCQRHRMPSNAAAAIEHRHHRCH